MKRTTNYSWKENGRRPGCPHCGAGADAVTVGLYWNFEDHCWQCIICGYRGYERVQHRRSPAVIIAERLWDEVLDTLDQEDDQMAPVT